MPFLERQFFTQMTVKRIEEKVGKPLLTSAALGGDKFHDICLGYLCSETFNRRAAALKLSLFSRVCL